MLDHLAYVCAGASVFIVLHFFISALCKFSVLLFDNPVWIFVGMLGVFLCYVLGRAILKP